MTRRHMSLRDCPLHVVGRRPSSRRGSLRAGRARCCSPKSTTVLALKEGKRKGGEGEGEEEREGVKETTENLRITKAIYERLLAVLEVFGIVKWPRVPLDLVHDLGNTNRMGGGTGVACKPGST
jgi:hypothetical protein